MSLTVARSLRSTVYGGDFGLSNFFYNSEVGGVIDLAPLDTSWRRNLLTYTEQFDNAAWTKVRGTISANAAVGGDGTLTADKFVEDVSVTQSHVMGRNLDFVSGVVYTFSIEVEAAGRTHWAFVFPGSSFTTSRILFDLTAITAVTTLGPATGTITALGEGRFRCTATATATTTSSGFFEVRLSDGVTDSYTGDGVSGIYIWGSQMERGLVATPYQPITDFHTEVRAMHPAAKLFQDTAGLQPVTAPGQTVALALMKGAREVEARRNLVSPTEDIHQWGGATLGTPVANAIAAPNGTITADLIVEGTTNQRHYRQKAPTFLADKWYTFSVYAKAGTRGFAGVVIGKSGSPYSRVGVVVDLSDGSFTDYNIDVVPDVIRHPVENLPDGWKRIAVSVYTGAAMTDGYAEVFPSNGSSTYLGDGVSGVYLWGAQVELGAAPTAYQSVSLADGSWTPGQHFVQSSASLRPTYAVRPKGGRRNLLTYTARLTNAAWSGGGGLLTITDGGADDRSGARNACLLVENTADNSSRNRVQGINVLNGLYYTMSIIIKPQGPQNRHPHLVFENGTAFGTPNAALNVNTGVVTQAGGVNRTAGAENLGGGWWRFWMRAQCVADGLNGFRLGFSADATSPWPTYVGDGLSGMAVEGVQVDVGVGMTPYQRVTSMFDVYEAGKTHYGALWFDGVDDFMVSSTVTPGTDKVQVFAGVRKNSDAAASILMELSNTIGNEGVFTARAPDGASARFAFVSKGSVSQIAVTTPDWPAPISTVMIGVGDISADVVSLHLNGALVASSSSDQGTGNFLAYPIYLGRRGGTTNPFNGEIEALIGYRFGPNLFDTQLTQIATFINSRTGAYV